MAHYYIAEIPALLYGTMVNYRVFAVFPALSTAKTMEGYYIVKAVAGEGGVTPRRQGVPIVLANTGNSSDIRGSGFNSLLRQKKKARCRHHQLFCHNKLLAIASDSVKASSIFIMKRKSLEHNRLNSLTVQLQEDAKDGLPRLVCFTPHSF
ncbi:MAG: hypothetical protein QXO49_05495 [Candidatus Bathyarchaeia archaeon]